MLYTVRARLDEDLHEQVVERAQGRTITDVVRTAIRTYLAVLAVIEREKA